MIMIDSTQEAKTIYDFGVTCSPSGGCAPNGITVKGSRDKERLSFLWLEVTDKCNMTCLHCYAESSPNKPLTQSMRYSDWCNCLKDARNLECESVMFIGGEPTLYPQLADLILFAYKLGYSKISVATNGLFIGSRIKEVVKSSKATLVYSIYSTNNHYHDYITTKRGSLSKSLINIAWALENQVDVAANIIQMDNNQENTKKTIEYLTNIGVKDIRLDRIRNVGRGSEYRRDINKAELCGACGNERLRVSSSGHVFRCVFDRQRPLGHHSEGLRKSLEKGTKQCLTMQIHSDG